jgi:hypothetical protein
VIVADRRAVARTHELRLVVGDVVWRLAEDHLRAAVRLASPLDLDPERDYLVRTALDLRGWLVRSSW